MDKVIIAFDFWEYVHVLRIHERPTVYTIRDDERISGYIFHDKKFDIGAHAPPRLGRPNQCQGSAFDLNCVLVSTYSILYAGFYHCPTSYFCFRKSDQNHFHPCAATLVSARACRITWFGNSLCSNSARQRSGFGTAA
jgi:hypothetical protein